MRPENGQDVSGGVYRTVRVVLIGQQRSGTSQIQFLRKLDRFCRTQSKKTPALCLRKEWGGVT